MLHVASAFGGFGHTVPQLPQWFGSEATLMHVVPPPQQISGVVHAHVVVQVPATHFAPGPHSVPQPPQLFESEPRSASQPFVGIPSQSANGLVHVKPHVEPEQVGDECGGAAHAVLHAPQCRGSLVL
ncbi:MAG: hypothetical protein NVS3B10_16670 [Polyangiales bacterium]